MPARLLHHRRRRPALGRGLPPPADRRRRARPRDGRPRRRAAPPAHRRPRHPAPPSAGRPADLAAQHDRARPATRLTRRHFPLLTIGPGDAYRPVESIRHPPTLPKWERRMAEPSSRRARMRVPHAILASTLMLTAIPMAASPAIGAAQAPNLVLHYDFEGDLSGGVIKDRSASGLDGDPGQPRLGHHGRRRRRLAGAVSARRRERFHHRALRDDPQRPVPRPRRHDDLHLAATGRAAPTSSGSTTSARTTTPPPSSPRPSAVTRRPARPSSRSTATPRSACPAPASCRPASGCNLVTTIDGQAITYYVNGAKIGSAARPRIDLAAIMHAPTEHHLRLPRQAVLGRAPVPGRCAGRLPRLRRRADRRAGRRASPATAWPP